MVEYRTKRVDPRSLLRNAAKNHSTENSTKSSGKLLRLVGVTTAAILGASAFGAIVVQANDDNSAMMFMRQNARSVSRSAPAPAYPATAYYARSVPQTAPTAYYAPQIFYPRNEPRRAETRQRNIVASYAPFTGFFPSDQGITKAPRRKAAAQRAETRSVRLTLPSPSRSEGYGGRITYCVRTCDGFYFPLSTSTGSAQGDEAACNRLCPTASTKLFVGERGAEIDNAQGRENGQRYASLANAFSYRKGIDKSCSCSTNGYGLASDYSVLRDGSLRVGDVVMTKTGMKIFSGGSFPYRETNFSSLGNSGLIDNTTRENLRKVEQASLPGRSGLAEQSRLTARSLATSQKTNEARELRSATALAQQSEASNLSTALRYVGPDRPQKTQ
jgi:Protein of unknown function (DUF2865)